MHALVLAAALATPSPDDSANIALATSILHRVGNRIWPGWSNAPFRIDLITANGPAEINFASPMPAPSFDPSFEATFPWQDGVPTIVIGEPQFVAAKTSTRWTVTLLHEHFHQWQNAWPPYFEAVNALGLSSPGDNGMWMLNYPFPYKDKATDDSYATLSQALADALAQSENTGASFAKRLHAFYASLSEKNRRYFAFQCWQEGVARYTEYAVAHDAATEHARDAAFLSDAQAQLFEADAQRTYDGIVKTLRDPSALETDQRVAFYAFGAGEALLLDRAHPAWRASYLDPRFDLATLF